MSQNSTNHIKIGSSGLNSISVGDFSVGVSTAADYGPTSDTGFYNGIVPPVGGYTIYVTKLSQGPSIHVPRTDEECLYYLNKYGANTNNIADALTWAEGQSNLLVRTSEYQLSDLNYPFTLNLNDITYWGQRFNGYINTSDSGFTCNGNTDTYNGIVYNLLGDKPTHINTLWTSAGLDVNNAYVWRINFTTGGEILARVALNPDNITDTIAICPIDQTNTGWQNGNIGTPLLAGTFTFPATFSLYRPTTQISSHTNWC